MNKINVLRIAADHFRTFYDDRVDRKKRRLSGLDLATFIGIPLGLGVVTFLVDPYVVDLTSMTTAASVFAGFMFAALILVLESGLTLSDGEQRGGTRGRLALLREVRANVAWTTILAVVTAGFLGLADLLASRNNDSATPYPLWYLIIGVILLSHLFLTLIMVVKRLYTVLGAEIDQRQILTKV